MALDVDRLAMVKQPVKDGRGNDLLAKEFLPVSEALVRGDQGR